MFVSFFVVCLPIFILLLLKPCRSIICNQILRLNRALFITILYDYEFPTHHNDLKINTLMFVHALNKASKNYEKTTLEKLSRPPF